MDDSDRNILASLRHESCEAHCDECGQCCGPDVRPTGPTTWGPHRWVTSGVTVLCEDCWPR